jgi:hypothetical protein
VCIYILKCGRFDPPNEFIILTKITVEYLILQSYEKMPLERDMILLENNIHLCSLGTIWTKKEGWFGDHVLLGSARVTEGKRDAKMGSIVENLEPVANDLLHP